jgi:hypothetical protein
MAISHTFKLRSSDNIPTLPTSQSYVTTIYTYSVSPLFPTHVAGLMPMTDVAVDSLSFASILFNRHGRGHNLM